jgi:hypothetical protein
MPLPLITDPTQVDVHDVRERSLDDRHIAEDAAIDPRKIAADDMEIDTWELADTLRDTLARIRHMLNAIIGKARWMDDPAVSLEEVAAMGGVTGGDAHDHVGGDGAAIVAAATSFAATNKLLGRATAGAGAGEEIALTAAGRALLDDAAASDQRTTLGLGTAATTAATDYAVAAKGVTGGDAHDHVGGDGAAIVAAATSFAATNKLLGRATAGAGAGEEIALTAAGRALLDDAAASDQRTTLGLGTAATTAATDYAVAAKGVTGGDSHDHVGGDGEDLNTFYTSSGYGGFKIFNVFVSAGPSTTISLINVDLTNASSTILVHARIIAMSSGVVDMIIYDAYAYAKQSAGPVYTLTIGDIDVFKDIGGSFNVPALSWVGAGPTSILKITNNQTYSNMIVEVDFITRAFYATFA